MKASGLAIVFLGVTLCLGAVSVAGAVEAAPTEPSVARPMPSGAVQTQDLADQLVRGRVAYGLNCISCNAPLRRLPRRFSSGEPAANHHESKSH